MSRYNPRTLYCPGRIFYVPAHGWFFTAAEGLQGPYYSRQEAAHAMYGGLQWDATQTTAPWDEELPLGILQAPRTPTRRR